MLPYENATSGAGALDEIRKVLTRFGCQRFGTMSDNEKGELIVQFNYRGREVLSRGVTGATPSLGSKSTPTPPACAGRLRSTSALRSTRPG